VLVSAEVGGTSILLAARLGAAQVHLALKNYCDASSATAKASGKVGPQGYLRRYCDAFRGTEDLFVVDAFPARGHSDVQVAREDEEGVPAQRLAVVAKDPNRQMEPSLCLRLVWKLVNTELRDDGVCLGPHGRLVRKTKPFALQWSSKKEEQSNVRDE
jgi:hypothetical protein